MSGTDGVSPTARALLALELLQGSPGVTAERLGEQLGVSERAARRYVAILREAGIPIESVRGPYGGYRVGRGLRLPPLVFSATEALGLVMAVLEGHHAAADATQPVGSAIAKILRGLPEPVAAQADAVRRAAAATPERYPVRPDPDTTVTLVGAYAGRRRLRIGYRSVAGREWTAEVDPWAVVVRHGRWYLLCFSHQAGAQRAYRIDRVTRAEVLEQGFDPPADLDPVAALEEHLAVGWEYDVEVLVDAPLAVVAAHLPRTMGRLEVVDTTTTRVVGTTSNPVMVVERLVVLPTTYLVVGGPEVRTAAREIAGRLSDAVR
ncbi:helix-turn-helix transcriptional regulator [Nocardioides sp. LHG3406-4]|uniref:helix-turn-helix transcriptional regulator n=1 Tax=Nocardioides sp. LHG3406-4 TaxID=2804575 RepID=UPI003CEA14F9